MSKRGEIVGAADFGSRDVRVLIARKAEDGTITVLGHGTAPGRGCVAQGVIQDLNAAQLALKRAMKAAQDEARLRVRSLFCGVNGLNVETFIREGKVKLDRGVVDLPHIKEALDIASREILAPGKQVTSSVTTREWSVDDLRVIEPLGINGQVLKVRVHFARLPAAIIDNLLLCVESQRYALEDLVFMPLAAGLGCLAPEDMDLGIAVLDMGHSTAGLAVYRDRRILDTHSFEWGGHYLVRDVAAGLQISFEEATELILEYGIAEDLIHADNGDAEAKDASQEPRGGQIKLRSAVRGAPAIADRSRLDEIVYERAKELMAKVRRHLEKRQLYHQLVRGVVLTGGASAIKNHDALAEAVFQVPCRVSMPYDVEILPHAANAPEFCGAVGVVRHGFAYRDALRAGRIEGRASTGLSLRRLWRTLRKYFL